MQKIGHLNDKKQLTLFSDYLKSKGLDNTIRDHEIWIYDHEQLQLSKQLFNEFTEAEDKSTYKVNIKTRQKKPIPKAHSKIGRLLGNRIGPVTLLLMIICIIVYLIGATDDNAIYQYLYFSQYQTGMPEILQGQIWRLFTPMFIHFSIFHILFNMYWLYEFGTLIENKISIILFMVLVLIIDLIANLAQYLIAPSLFGGMSAVCYGLFGYLWIRSKFDPWSGIYLSQQIVGLFIIWLILCFTGYLGPIANVAHVTGLIVGIIIAFLHNIIKNSKLSKRS